MINWQRKLLKEVVLDWIKGSTPGRAHKEYYSTKSGIPWVRVSDLKGGILTETELYLTPEGSRQIKGQVPKGAVLLSVSGTIGKAAIAGRDLKLNQAVQAMVFDETMVLAEYAYYYFQYYRRWLETKANTVTIPNLTRIQLENTYILFPCPEEQRYIVDIMKQAELLPEKNQCILASIEQILYSAMYKQLQRSSGRGKGQQLKDYLKEPVLQGVINNEEKGANCCYINAFSDRTWSLTVSEDDFTFYASEEELNRYAVKQGDILIRRHRTDSGSVCVLAVEDFKNVIFGRNLLRVRVRQDKLRPEFLAAWLCFYFTYIDCMQNGDKWAMNRAFVSDIPIPPVPLEVQDKFAKVIHLALEIQKRAVQVEMKKERLFQALLASALTSDMTKNYRSLHQLEEPDLSFIWKHYQATGLERITGGSFAENADWETVFNSKEQQMIEYLSGFQKDILRKYMEVKEPMPIHAIFKKVMAENQKYDRNYSVQDAIATVKILESWGFLDSALPEKIFFDEKAITDLHGGSITIRKYRIPLSD